MGERCVSLQEGSNSEGIVQSIGQSLVKYIDGCLYFKFERNLVPLKYVFGLCGVV
jgi:hypothetical protein